MLARLRSELLDGRLWALGVVAVVLVGATALGYLASVRWLLLLCLGIGMAVLLHWPLVGLLALVPAALVARLDIGTGTEVSLNQATLLVPALLGIWVVDMVRRGKVRLVASTTNLPLLFFLAAGLLSLAIGIGTWDPAVPRSDSFTLVQLVQWAIFAFSAIAFWLTGNLITSETELRRLTLFYLAVAGGVAMFYVVGGGGQLILDRILTVALNRAPFRLLLFSVAAGQLLFNRELSTRWRLFAVAVVATVLFTVLFQERDTVSHMAGVGIAAGVLAWLRWPRLRWPVLLLLAALALSGVLTSAIYEFAGGGDEWVESGGSRLALIERVVQVTMRNPITGLGPAAYRPYAGTEPLFYWGAYWIAPQISSHNNYVDLFSHVGLLGMALFFWFAVEVARLGLRLRAHFTQGFAAGYVNAMLAVGAGALVLMMFADWILPFIYNIGFSGFQASVLVWLFLGGLVALEQIAKQEPAV